MSVNLTALTELARNPGLDPYCAHDVGQHLTCSEVWWLIDVLTAMGQHDTAVALRENHRDYDEDAEDCHGERPT